ncbi:MAG: T9SS type A sorting domain-containing protein [Bacteroidales bacterium]|nr:T9SS type A sorting domain-containing protein [Bacteroidales bacterium]
MISRKRLFVFLFLVLICKSGFSQWRYLEGYRSYGLDWVFMGNVQFDVSPDDGIYVSSEYSYSFSPHYYWFVINKSHDGGTIWSDCTIPNGGVTYCNNIFCTAPSEMVAITSSIYSGAINSTINDGSEWITQGGQWWNDGSFFGGDFVNSHKGMIFFYNFPLASTSVCCIENGTFEFRTSDTLDLRHASIVMTDESTAYMLCRDVRGVVLPQSGNNCIVKTSNFGQSWTKVYTDTVFGLIHLQIDSLGEGVAVGNNGRIIHADSGKDWTEMESGSSKTIRYTTSRNGTFLCVGDSGLILKKENGQNEWVDLSYGTANYRKIKVNSKFIGYVLTDSSQILYSQQALGLPDLKKESAVSVFPNPVENQLNYNLPSNYHLKDIIITDMAGMVQLQFYRSQNGLLDLKNLAPGIYFVTFQCAEGRFTQKLVKQ